MIRPIATLLLALLATGAGATEVRVTTVRAAPISGLLVDITGKTIRVETSGGEVRKVPLEEIVGLEFSDPDDPALLPRLEPDDERTEREVTIRLAGGDRLLGVLLDGTEDDLTLAGHLLGAVRVPIDAVRDIRFVKAGEKGILSRHEGEKDCLTYRTGDVLTGWITRFTKSSLRIDCVLRDDYRVDYRQVAAVHLQPDAVEPPKGLLVQLQLVDGGRLTGREPRLEGGRLHVRPALPEFRDDRTTWSVPLTSVRHLTVLGGAFVHLSDVSDLGVKVVPYFPPADPMLDPEIWLAPRRDRSFLDRPLSLGGRVVHKGVGVVSGTVLRVKLDGAYRLFRATVGVDDHAGPRGSVTFEVLVDGRSRWKSPLLRTGAKPVTIPPVNLSGARVLELKVGHGDEAGADVQDIADWGEPILVK